MALTEADTQSTAPRQHGTRLIVLAAVLGFGLLMAAAVLLWLKNGTAVFFETLSAGLAACF